MNEKERGWLWKQSPHKLKSWRHRYFILHFTYLEYFESEKDSSSLGSIPLGMVVCYVPFKNETERPNSFALQTPDRTFYLSSDTEADMKRWVDAIKQSIHDIFVKQVTPYLPTAQAYSGPSGRKEHNDGLKAFSRGITKRLLMKKEKSFSREYEITNPTSSISTLSQPTFPLPLHSPPIQPPSPSTGQPLSHPHPFLPPNPPQVSEPSTAIPISPTTSPQPSPRNSEEIHETQHDIQEENSPRKPFVLPASRPLAHPLPTPPHKPPTSPLPSLPALPSHFMKPKGLVRPQRPPTRPPPPPTPTSPPLPPRTKPLPPLRNLPRSPSANLTQLPKEPNKARLSRSFSANNMTHEPKVPTHTHENLENSSQAPNLEPITEETDSNEAPNEKTPNEETPTVTKPAIPNRDRGLSRSFSASNMARETKEEGYAHEKPTLAPRLSRSFSANHMALPKNGKNLPDSSVPSSTDTSPRSADNSQERFNPAERMLGSNIPLTAQITATMKKNSFTVYQVDFQWNTHTWTIFRRFKQFDELDGYLSGILRPEYSLPSKTLTHNFKEKFVERRREELDRYLQGCCKRVTQIMRSKKARKNWIKFIKPAQLGDLRAVDFNFDIFVTPENKGLLD